MVVRELVKSLLDYFQARWAALPDEPAATVEELQEVIREQLRTDSIHLPSLIAALSVLVAIGQVAASDSGILTPLPPKEYLPPTLLPSEETPLSNDTPTAVWDFADQPGTSAAASRGDHKHRFGLETNGGLARPAVGIRVDVDGATIELSAGKVALKSGVCAPGTYANVTVDTYGRVTSGT